jgi:hypothetical protein
MNAQIEVQEKWHDYKSLNSDWINASCMLYFVTQFDVIETDK